MDPLYLCRLCLCRSESFFDIFGENVGLGFSVETAIKDLLQFDVARVEGVPSLACSTCVKDLNHFRIFKSRCVDSKVTFERRLRIREKSPPSRECGTVVSDIYDGDVAKGGRRIEESSETSEDVCGQGLLSEDSNGVSDSAEVKVKQEEDNPEEVDIPLGIVKIEHDIEQTSLHEQGMYGEELAADNGLGQSSPHGEWDLDEDAEDYGAPEGGSEISNSEETSGISGSGISSIVLLKTESLAEISTRDSEEYMEMSSMDGSANADPQPDRYSKADLKRALDEVRAGGAIRVVGRAYGIPESTIRGHLSQERLSKQEMKRKRSMALKSKQKELTGFLRGLKESGKPDEPKKLRSNEEAKSKRLNHIIGSSPPSDGLDRFGHFLERLLTGEDQNKPSQERPEKVKPRKKQLETERRIPRGQMPRFGKPMRRARYSEQLKIKVVRYAELTSNHLAAMYFGIPGRNVRRWRMLMSKRPGDGRLIT